MFKHKQRDKDSTGGATAQPQGIAVDRYAASPAASSVSCIGSNMSIVGNVECSGPLLVFGRIEGELRATDLVIGEGGQIEGGIQANEVTINGHVKGIVRAMRVTIQGGTVEGDIIHRMLSMDENSVFAGMSRRVDDPVERHADDTVEPAVPKMIGGPALVPSAVANGHLQTN
jgi:cytoskeletal protein CcmA (bactofilin family)